MTRTQRVQTHKIVSGFTLVELLVVITVISLLASLVVSQIGITRMRARDAKRVSDIRSIQEALTLDYDANGSYIASYNLPNSSGVWVPDPSQDCGAIYFFFCTSAPSTQRRNGQWIYNRSGRDLSRYQAVNPIPPSRNTDTNFPGGAYYYYAWDDGDTTGYAPNNNGPGSQAYTLVYRTEGLTGGRQTSVTFTTGYWSMWKNTGGVNVNYGEFYKDDHVFTVGKTGE